MQQIQIPPLAEGEIYVGSIGDAQGNLHHVILLPGDNDDATWSAQMAWAENHGDLPTRIELAHAMGKPPRPVQEGLVLSNETHHLSPAWYSSSATRRFTLVPRARLVPSADCQFNHLVISRTP